MLQITRSFTARLEGNRPHGPLWIRPWNAGKMASTDREKRRCRGEAPVSDQGGKDLLTMKATGTF